MRSSALSIRAGAFALALVMAAGLAEAAGQAGGQPAPPGGPGRGGQVRDGRPAGDLPTGTSSIVGTVAVSGTGGPARRARVSLSGESLRGGRSVTTDDQGRYAFSALPAGRFTLSASKPGHLSASYGQRVPGSGRPGTPIQLEEGQRLTIGLQLPRGGVISGTVLDEQGEAVPGTLVRVFRYSMQSGVRTLQQAGSDATDDRGSYRIYGLPLGDYLVCAVPRSAGPGGPALQRLQEAVTAQAGAAGQQVAAAVLDRVAAAQAAAGQSAEEEPASGYAPVYYPGTTRASDATSLMLNVGEEKLGVDFQLQLMPMARVEGMVVYPSGQGPGGVQVQLVSVGEDVGGLGGSSARVDGDGTLPVRQRRPRAVFADCANRRRESDRSNGGRAARCSGRPGSRRRSA